MKRREFILWGGRVGGAALVAPALVSLVSVGTTGCDDAPPDSGSSAPPPGTTRFAVDTGGSPPHTHSVDIPDSALASPPPAGWSGPTSNVGGHVHTVSLSQQDLIDIGSGSASGSTSFAAGHLHGYTFP